jgi:hypothetical protein
MTIKYGEVAMTEIQHRPQNENPFPRFMRRSEAARYIRENYGIPCAPSTLAKYACLGGGGPAFRRATRFPIYERDDLDAWAEHRLTKLVHSTSELEPQADW